MSKNQPSKIKDLKRVFDGCFPDLANTEVWFWFRESLKAQREETIRDIRKWSKGRNVTKDALRNYLNSLDKLNKK